MTKKLYWSQEWKVARREVLARDKICCRPGCNAPAERVDHVIPWKAGGHAFDRGNLEGLCQSCHNQKTALRDGGFGRPRDPDRVLPGNDESGRPLDPIHPWNARRKG